MGFCKTNDQRVAGKALMRKAANDFFQLLDNSAEYKNLSEAEMLDLKKTFTSSDVHEVLSKDNVKGFGHTKKMKEIFFNFFGMNENWSWGRNIGGMFMVHCPEYPTYFIPSYSQSKATGEAGHVKKGEIPRGLITGGLEGIAVGALVSGEKIKGKEMVPYVILGAGLQFISCTVFPWLGEKLGRYQYNQKMIKQGKPTVSATQTVEKIANVDNNKPTKPANPAKPSFSGKQLYASRYSSGFRI